MKTKSRVFAPGPTPVPQDSRLEMAKTPPYHRTQEFSDVIEDVTKGLQQLLSVDWPIVPVSSSGTGAMQTAVSNLTGEDDRVLVIESGKFGERWSELVERTNANLIKHEVPWGEAASADSIARRVDNESIDIVYGTLVETSTLVRHPIREIGNKISSNEVLFVVDAISGFAAERFQPNDCSVDAFVLGSQKGLMAPSGLAFVGANERAQRKSRSVETETLYFDLGRAIDRLHRDFQTPWTPPLNLLKATRQSVMELLEEGLESVLERHEFLASACRDAVKAMGLDVFSSKPSVVGTAVTVPDDVDGVELQEHLHGEYNTYIPGGQKHLEGEILRLGHLGDVDYFDLVTILAVLEQGLLDFGFQLNPGESIGVAQKRFQDVNSE